MGLWLFYQIYNNVSLCLITEPVVSQKTFSTDYFRKWFRWFLSEYSVAGLWANLDLQLLLLTLPVLQ